MERVFLVRILFFISIMVFAMQVSAQHFISIQAEDRQPFAIEVNGNKFASSKTGTLKIGNLSAGNYSLVITPSGNKYPPQSFTVAVDKTDLAYTFVNQGIRGWALKNTKAAQVITSSTATSTPGDGTNSGGQTINSPFAQMLAQVINDPDLLKATPWVLTNKVEGNEDIDRNAAMQEAMANDTNTYVAETKGVIKADERPVKEGTEMVFVDFNAYGGDTIHVVIPNADGSINKDLPAAEVTAQATANTNTADSAKKDSSVTTPPIVKNDPAAPNDTTAIVLAKNDVAAAETPAVKTPEQKTDTTAITKKADETVAPVDTSSNKPYINPFYKGDNTQNAKTVTDKQQTEDSTNTSKALKPNATEPSKMVTDKLQTIGSTNTGKIQKPDAKETVVSNESNGITAADNIAKAVNKQDCKKMLSDNDKEKLKHKIYLETDDDKILSITKKALSGKCISTAQVKDLASMFLTDDGRYSFFFTVYPYVYDFGNFTTLRTYMIDLKYREMFDAMVK